MLRSDRMSVEYILNMKPEDSLSAAEVKDLSGVDMYAFSRAKDMSAQDLFKVFEAAPLESIKLPAGFKRDEADRAVWRDADQLIIAEMERSLKPLSPDYTLDLASARQRVLEVKEASRARHAIMIYHTDGPACGACPTLLHARDPAEAARFEVEVMQMLDKMEYDAADPIRQLLDGHVTTLLPAELLSEAARERFALMPDVDDEGLRNATGACNVVGEVAVNVNGSVFTASVVENMPAALRTTARLHLMASVGELSVTRACTTTLGLPGMRLAAWFSRVSAERFQRTSPSRPFRQLEIVDMLVERAKQLAYDEHRNDSDGSRRVPCPPGKVFSIPGGRHSLIARLAHPFRGERPRLLNGRAAVRFLLCRIPALWGAMCRTNRFAARAGWLRDAVGDQPRGMVIGGGAAANALMEPCEGQLPVNLSDIDLAIVGASGWEGATNLFDKFLQEVRMEYDVLEVVMTERSASFLVDHKKAPGGGRMPRRTDSGLVIQVSLRVYATAHEMLVCYDLPHIMVGVCPETGVFANERFMLGYYGGKIGMLLPMDRSGTRSRSRLLKAAAAGWLILEAPAIMAPEAAVDAAHAEVEDEAGEADVPDGMGNADGQLGPEAHEGSQGGNSFVLRMTPMVRNRDVTRVFEVVLSWWWAATCQAWRDGRVPMENFRGLVRVVSAVNREVRAATDGRVPWEFGRAN